MHLGCCGGGGEWVDRWRGQVVMERGEVEVKRWRGEAVWRI